MTTITIKETYGIKSLNREYTVDLDRQFGGYEKGDLICSIAPFHDVPLTLEIAIRIDGSIIFRSWKFNAGGNRYLHTNEEAGQFGIPTLRPTEAQIDTVNGLFSGRIKWEGLRLTPGKSLQDLCPINLEREEQLTGKKIYLA